MSEVDLTTQLRTREEEIESLKKSFTEHVSTSKELEAELEDALESSEKMNKTLSMQKVKAEENAAKLKLEIDDCYRKINILQSSLKDRDDMIEKLQVSCREMEQLHSAEEEKLRQLQFLESCMEEERDEAIEARALLLCDLEELRSEMQANESRLKAELTEMQAEIARHLDQQEKMQTSSNNDDMSPANQDNDRFPLFHMFILATAVLSSALALTTLFPYIGFMIIDIGAANSINEAGYYSGAIASAMMFGRFASSFLWGKFADHYGRKPPLIIGCMTISLMSILFGLSSNLLMMVISRVLLGLFNPIWGTAKTLVSELCSRKYEARAMGLTASCWSLGVVVGPVIGGFLANPVKLYPTTFSSEHDSIFNMYPYLLPNLVISVFSLASCLMVYFFLPETLTDHKHPVTGDKVKRGATIFELLRTPGVAPAFSAYFVLSFVDLSFSEVIPLWAIASVSVGGLGMEQRRIGFLMTFTGCLQVVYTMVVYPMLVKLLGRVESFRIGQIVFIPFCLGITLLNKMKPESLQQFVMLVFVFAVARAGCSLGNSSIGLIVNRCVRKEQRASINGLSMGIGSMAKAIGPMTSTFIFAWSINPSQEDAVERDFPLDVHFIFIIFSLLSVVCIAMPLVYYETDEQLDKAWMEKHKANGDGEADDTSSLLGKDGKGKRSASYGATSNV